MPSVGTVPPCTPCWYLGDLLRDSVARQVERSQTSGGISDHREHSTDAAWSVAYLAKDAHLGAASTRS